MIVMNSATSKKCYAYKTENNEGTSNEIKAGVMQAGMIEVSKYRVPVIQN